MGIYDNAIATALRLIAKYGRDISIVKSSSTPNDSNKPWRGTQDAYTEASPDSTVVTKGVFVSNTDLGFLETYQEGGMQARGEKVCLVAASGLIDLSKHEGIKDGTVTWKIVKAHVLEPGDSKILYIFEVAR